jgi:DNA-directed RNA polymerase specialized sigma24 family protein
MSRTTDAKADRRRVLAAIAGDELAIRDLVRELTPVIQSRVARVLVRTRGASAGSVLRQDVLDVSQQVFERLFADNGMILRTWNREAGLSLMAFVGLIAERDAVTVVRSRKLNPTTEAPTDDAALESTLAHVDIEGVMLTRSVVRVLVERLERALSPLGVRVFRALFVDERDVESAGKELGLSAEAIYQWRTRIRQTARQLAAELHHEETHAVSNADGGVR